MGAAMVTQFYLCFMQHHLTLLKDLFTTYTMSMEKIIENDFETVKKRSCKTSIGIPQSMQYFEQ